MTNILTCLTCLNSFIRRITRWFSLFRTLRNNIWKWTLRSKNVNIQDMVRYGTLQASRSTWIWWMLGSGREKGVERGDQSKPQALPTSLKWLLCLSKNKTAVLGERLMMYSYRRGIPRHDDRCTQHVGVFRNWSRTGHSGRRSVCLLWISMIENVDE